MAVGMVALHPVWTFVLDGVGWSAFLALPRGDGDGHGDEHDDRDDRLDAFRGHGWRPCAEMGAAMYVPFVVLFAPMWVGLLSSGDMLLWGHVLMLFAMAGAMAIRPDEYAHC